VDDRTFGDKVSDCVAAFGGSWKFILLSSFIFILWILFNTLVYFEHFDKFPFILLNLVLSFIAAFQAPFIMMSQNRTEKKQDEAYRLLFSEIKELIEQDMESEVRIEALEAQVLRELVVLRDQHNQLLNQLQHAIDLEKIALAEIAKNLTESS
jgi:uncharacterized membrane protein